MGPRSGPALSCEKGEERGGVLVLVKRLVTWFVKSTGLPRNPAWSGQGVTEVVERAVNEASVFMSRSWSVSDPLRPPRTDRFWGLSLPVARMT